MRPSKIENSSLRVTLFKINYNSLRNSGSEQKLAFLIEPLGCNQMGTQAILVHRGTRKLFLRFRCVVGRDVGKNLFCDTRN